MKRWVIYYRAIPTLLAMQISSDKAWTLTKDGLKDLNGIDVPAAIITLQTKNDHSDADKVSNMENLLARLLKSSNILGWKALD